MSGDNSNNAAMEEESSKVLQEGESVGKTESTVETEAGVTGEGELMEDDEICIILSDDDSVKNETDKEDAIEKTEDGSEFKDEEEDEKSEEERAKIEEGFFADDLEMLELTLPQQTLIKDSVLKLWNSRKLVLYPISAEELQKSQLNEFLADSHCSRLTIHLDRENANSEKWIGAVDLVFDSKTRTKEVAEELQKLGDIKVQSAVDVKETSQDFNEMRSAHFTAYESKKWPSCLVCVKYLPHNISEDKLREIFPDAFDAMLFTNERPNLTEAQRLTGFLFYNSPDEAEEAVTRHSENKMAVEEARLAFFKYDRVVHPQLIDQSFLTLGERYVILKEKNIVEKLAKVRGGHCAATLEKLNSKVQEDDTIRKTYGLSIPSVEELRFMKNLKVLRGDDAFRVIKQRGLLWRNRVKLMACGPETLEPPVHPKNKGLRSGLTNPNKRKRRKIALESKTGFGTSRPLFRRLGTESTVRFPSQKMMRFGPPKPEFASRGRGNINMYDSAYLGMTYQAGLQAYGLPPGRTPPSLMARLPMAHGGMPHGSAPYMMVPRSAAGVGRATSDNRITNRLMNMAHGNIINSTSSNITPRLMMTRPQPSVSFGGSASAPVRRPAPIGQLYPRPGAPTRRGVLNARARPFGRAGWAVR